MKDKKLAHDRGLKGSMVLNPQNRGWMEKSARRNLLTAVCVFFCFVPEQRCTPSRCPKFTPIRPKNI